MTGDWPARLRALDPRRSFIVKAPAGSGKTELLTARYLALLAAGGPGGAPCTPGQILAVTFTDKAALEMKARIALWLDRAADPSYEPRSDWDREVVERARAAWKAHGGKADLLRNPTAYRVGTFHGFCASVCRAWPVESRIPVGADVMEDQNQSRVIEEAVRALLVTLRHKAPESPMRQALERRLAALNNSTRRLVGQLSAVLKNRDQVEQIEHSLASADPGGRAVLERHFRSRVKPARDYFLNNEARWLALAAAGREVAPKGCNPLPDEIPGSGLESVWDWVAVASVFLAAGKGGPSPRKALPKDWPEDVKAFVKGLPDEVASALAFFLKKDFETGWLAADGEALRDTLLLLKGALTCLESRIPGQGLDYLELELGARRALGNAEGLPSESLIFFHEHLRHLLVDEAQDMNPFQVGLLGTLTEGWELEDGDNPRTLFVVGDPKQSIYRFRGAEVALFDEMREAGIPREGEGPFTFGEEIHLTSNFRSAHRLVRFTNALFERVMADPVRDHDEVSFGAGDPAATNVGEAAAAGADQPTATRLVVFTAPSAKDDDEEEGDGIAASREQAEADWVAAEVAALHRQKPTDTIGILIPRRTQLDLYVAALRSRQVPVRMVEGENLAAKPEVFHLHALFKALARPYDDAAWACALRAPWCRVGEEVLLALKQEAVGGRCWSEAILVSELSEVKRFADAVKPALGDFGREAYHATLLRAWEKLGGPEATAARYDTYGVGNALEYLSLLQACGGLPAEEAIDLIEDRLEKAYTPPDPAAAASPVQLMTIHKAKGLEFDHVFAVYLGYRPGRSGSQEKPPYLLLPLPEANGGRALCVAMERDARWRGRSLGHDLLADLARKREQAEVKRLFYVAVTRARLSLTLTGCGKRDEKTPLTAAAGSPLGLLLSATCAGGEAVPSFAELGFDVRVLAGPEPQKGRPVERRAFPEVAAERLESFPLPYFTRSPSDRLDREEDHAPRPGEDEREAEDDGTAKAIGVVIHRLLETLAVGHPLPRPEGVAMALRAEGVEPRAASGLAPSLLAEARDAWEDHAFSALREGAECSSEWPLESSDGQETVMVGRLDLLIVKPGEVAVVDYKTSRFPADVLPEAFESEMLESYGPQLRAYRRMLERHPAFRGKSVATYLLLTQLPGGRLIRVE